MSSSSHSYPKGTFQQLLQSGKYKPGKAASSPAQAPLVSVLGDDAQTGQALTLGDVERRSGLYVLGKPGMGKTTLLVNLALQDIEQGYGVFFLDPHADAIADILRRLPVSRKDDVILLDVEDEARSFCINLLACKDITSLKERTNTYTRAYNIFHTIWSKEWGPWLEMIVSNTLYAFIENQGYTLADVPLFLRDAAFREYLVQNIRFNKEPADFWREEFGNLLNERQQREQAQAALTRVRQLLTHPYVKHVIGYPTTTIDFQQIMAERKIILVSLSANLAENIKQFLGTILVSELLKAARDRVRIPQSQRHQFCVFVDEFQNFATPDFAAFITEARKFSIATTIAHQERFGQLEVDRRILGATLATAHKIIYQPTVADAETVAKEFADRPEPAWVEVLKEESVEELEQEWVELLEEESVEVLEEESEEQKIDEWEDGIEPILAVAQNPLEYLLRGHSNPIVRRLVVEVVQPIEDAIETKEGIEGAEDEALTQFLQKEKVFVTEPGHVTFGDATHEDLVAGKQKIALLFAGLTHGTIAYGSSEMIERLAALIWLLRTYIGFCGRTTWVKEWDHYGDPRETTYGGSTWYDDKTTQPLLPGFIREVARLVEQAISLDGADENRRALVSVASATKRDFIRARVHAHLHASGEVFYTGGDDEYNEQLVVSDEDFYIPPSGVPESKRREWLLQRRVAVAKLTPVAREEYTRLVDFLMKLCKLCLAMSTAEQVMVQSGQYQPRKHRQIHYTPHSRLVLQHPRREQVHPRRELNHPRLDVTHPQRSIADMVAEKELDLLDLATYTAYYKLTSTQRTTKGRLVARPLPASHDLLIRTRLVKHILASSTYSIDRSLIDKAIQIRQRQEDGQDPVSGSQPSPVPEDQGKKTERPRWELAPE